MDELHVRPFRNWEEVKQLINWTEKRYESSLHTIDLPYRMSSLSPARLELTRVWEDMRGRVYAYALLQEQFNDLDFVIDAEWKGKGIEEQIALFAEELVSRRKRSLYINLGPGDTHFKAVVKRQKWPQLFWNTVRLYYFIKEDIAAPQLSAGFLVRPFAPNELLEYVSLHRAAFQSEVMTTGWRKRMLMLGRHHSELQLAAFSADGTPAGFCLGWYLRSLGNGQIEPIGVHPSFRRCGLGHLLLKELFCRLKQLGARGVYVDCYSNNKPALSFYQSMGFRVEYRTTTYRIS